MFDDHDTLPVIFASVSFVILKIPKNRLAASNEPSCDTCHRTHLWVFLCEPPGCGACIARRRELAWL